MAVAIVTDTCHYLPVTMLVQQHGIHEVSLYVHWHDETQRESEISDYDDYYARLARRTRSCPRPPSRRSATSWPSTSRCSDGGQDIVSIHLAGGMSGTVRSAEQAREQLGRARGARPRGRLGERLRRRGAGGAGGGRGGAARAPMPRRWPSARSGPARS